MPKNKAIDIAGHTVEPGQRVTIDLDAGQLYTHEPVYMPVHVVHGRQPGPVLFISAAIHGDELNGIEIVRRVLDHSAIKRLRGTLLAVPIVNILGVVHQSRYLPDRRDLNRSFPGSPSGSLASRLAHLFMSCVVKHADYGIDLHTGAIHRANLPQIRARLEDEKTLELASAFGAPLVLDAQIRDASLRDAATALGIRVLLYEAGEALRFDEVSIRVGVRGVINVMRSLGMLPKRESKVRSPFIARSSAWLRAPCSGIFRARAELGTEVSVGDEIGVVADPFGESEQQIVAPFAGLVIGRTSLPLVHEGEALFHIGRVSKPGRAAALAEQISDIASADPQYSGDSYDT